MEGTKDVTLKDLVKIIAANKKMTITEAAKASGREQSTLSNMLARGNTNINVLREVFEGMGEDLVLLTSDGTKYRVVCNS